jgi:hypothetical protein
MSEAELVERLKIVTTERNKYHAELTDLKLTTLRKDVDDHETRLRSVETTSTRSNVIFALSSGGGLISIIALLKMFQGI